MAMMQELQNQLNDAGYICDSLFASAVEAAMHTKPVAGAILEGPIGTGKSYLPEVLASILKTKLFFYQCFPGTKEEDLLIKMLPSETTISGVALSDGVIVQAVRATAEADTMTPVILVLDEWDKTRPSADAFLLDLIQSGRINFAGQEYQADLSKLMIFLTVNNERELSEPLLRRLPKIEFDHLPPTFVHRALSMTHKGHPYLFQALVLYERCLMADLPKPATIQELRQFLDAITRLGDRSDWDSLVFQFLTKSEESHALLRSVEKEPVQWRRRARIRLNADAYDVRQRANLDDAGELASLTMPSLAAAKGFDYHLDVPDREPDLSTSAGIIEINDDVYNEAVRLAGAPGKSPSRLGDFAEITADRFLNLKQAVSFRDLEKVAKFWGENGEILIVEPQAQWQDVKALQEWAPIRIVKYSNREILAKAEGVDLRWTPEAGAEIIVHLAHKDVFDLCFGRGWGTLGEAKWIGRKGCIYRRYAEGDRHEDRTPLAS